MSRKRINNYPINSFIECDQMRSYIVMAAKILLPKDLRDMDIMPENTHNLDYDYLYSLMIDDHNIYKNSKFYDSSSDDTVSKDMNDDFEFVMEYIILKRRYNGKANYSFKGLSKRLNSNRAVGKRRALMKRALKNFVDISKENDKHRSSDLKCLNYPANRVVILYIAYVRDYYLTKK